jgi:hypothetical protein
MKETTGTWLNRGKEGKPDERREGRGKEGD